MSPKKVYLNSLVMKSKEHVVRVKVIHKRTSPPKEGKQTFQRLLLVDEMGQTMRAALFGHNVDYFDDIIDVEACYDISNVVVARINFNRHEHYPDEKQMHINTLSSVKCLAATKVPCPLTFNCTLISKLPHDHIPQNASFDVIADVLEYIPPTKVPNKFSSTLSDLSELHITDDSCSEVLRVFLYNECAFGLEILDNVEPREAVILLSGLKTKLSPDMNLSSTYYTMIELNPEVARANILLQLFFDVSVTDGIGSLKLAAHTKNAEKLLGTKASAVYSMTTEEHASFTTKLGGMYMNEQIGMKQQSNRKYVYSEMNPYVSHPDPLKEAHKLFRKGLLSEAVLALEAEIMKNPGNAEGWRLLRIPHAENDDNQQAIVAMLKAQEEDPTNLEVLLALRVGHTNGYCSDVEGSRRRSHKCGGASFSTSFEIADPQNNGAFNKKQESGRIPASKPDVALIKEPSKQEVVLTKKDNVLPLRKHESVPKLSNKPLSTPSGPGRPIKPTSEQRVNPTQNLQRKQINPTSQGGHLFSQRCTNEDTVEEKLEAAKRRLQERYQEAENDI
ncbi:hypothetical protein V2J09_018487 [Rumex salicifolius]